MHKALIILHKEWLELRKDRGLLLGTLLPPLLLTLLPTGILFATRSTPDEDVTELGAALRNPALAGLDAIELSQALIGQQFAILFLLMPLIVPSIIASYSIVGEKTRRTLEPLLATPIATWELLLGKSLAALLPAVLITWVCGAIFGGGVAIAAVSARVVGAILSPAWLIVLIFCTPLLALIAIAAMVAVSSRVNDPRTAQQLSGVIVVPVIALVFGQLTGFLVLDVVLALGASVVLALVAALAIWGATRLFQREVILTRWT